MNDKKLPKEAIIKISVIIPCFNAVETIGAQLDALTTQRWHGPWEVVVVDNRSTDASMDIVKKYFNRIPGLRIVHAFAHQGAPYALNVGAKAANGDALLFCDADDIVGDGWLGTMGEALLSHDFVACRMDTEKLNIQRYGYGNPQAHGTQMLWYPPYLPHAGGGTIGIKTSLFHTVGGFDESLHYLQDTDFCFKVQFTGVKLHFVPDAVIHVRYRNTIFGVYRQSRNYAEYNVVLFKRYRSLAPENPHLWKQYLDDCKKLLISFFKRKNRYNMAWDFGRQIGRLKGCIKNKVPPV